MKRIAVHPARSIARAMSAWLLALSTAAHALVLGEPVAVSPIGAPLRVEIAIAKGDASRAGECIRLAPGGDDAELPWVREARISTVGRAPDARILVEGSDPLSAPAVQLGLEEVCETSLRREYTLLLAFPEEGTAAAANGHPEIDDASLSERAGTGTDRGAAPAGREGTRGEAEAAAAGAARTAGPAAGDRLRREREAAAALGRTRAAEQELNERIRRLEETRDRLMAEARVVPSERASSPDQRPGQNEVVPTEPQDARDGPSASSPWPLSAIVAVFAAFSLLLALALREWNRRRKRDLGATEFEAESGFTAWHLSGAERTPPGNAALRGLDARSDDAARTGRAVVAATTTLSAHARVLPDFPSSRPAAADVPITAALDEKAAEDYQSAIELAEILMGFGRVQGAAETLAEFIGSNPRRSIAPWLKLLEVYRTAGLRPEFDAVARQLNNTFNVKRVSWETFDAAQAARDTLEALPHVAKTLQELWGTSACQDYLEWLLRENRDGSREGFPLSVIDEILTLQAVLEEQLGPYRADDPEPETAR